MKLNINTKKKKRLPKRLHFNNIIDGTNFFFLRTNSCSAAVFLLCGHVSSSGHVHASALDTTATCRPRSYDDRQRMHSCGARHCSSWSMMVTRAVQYIRYIMACDYNMIIIYYNIVAINSLLFLHDYYGKIWCVT